ncbi:MAG: alpha-ketoglutarate-dependent dioxygenase AlkB [Myxococcota bacterium]
MKPTDFVTYRLDMKADMFDTLSRSVDFEAITSGRQGNHLVDVSERGVPIVRTTTQYKRPAHHFAPIHHQITDAIQRAASAQFGALSFNNALIELYDRNYIKMGYHSDQALDLEPGSFIALYSCYERPKAHASLRTLKIKSKTTHEETALVLEHNGVVLFSLETNRQYAHKIVLTPPPSPHSTEPDNRWLGITFRSSKTYIQFREHRPYLTDGTVLQLADEAQRKAFYRLRGQENRQMDFSYPNTLHYTISLADTLEPKGP